MRPHERLPRRWQYGRRSDDGRDAARDAEAAIAAVVDAFGEWRDADDPHGRGWLAARLLHFKWIHLDGDLARWTAGDLEEILLRAFPREVALGAEDAADVVPLTRALLSFLDEADVLTGDGLPQLRRTLAEIGRRFDAEMTAPRNYGMTKRLVAELLGPEVAGAQLAELPEDRGDGGAPVADPVAVRAALGRFAARPRTRGAAVRHDDGARVAVEVAVADADRLAAAALRAPVLAQVRRLLDHVGPDGRQLTARGNLRLADGRALVDLLGTADVFDRRVGDRIVRTRSTTELVEVDLVFRLALAARLARRRGRRVFVTPQGRRVDDEPVAAWSVLLRAMIRRGVADRITGGDTAGGELGDVTAVLATVAAAPSALAVGELASRLAHPSPGTLSSGDPAPDAARTAVVDRWVWLGILERTDDSRDVGPETRGGAVVLTPLGWWWLQRGLEASALDIPVVPDVRDEDARGVLRRASVHGGDAAVQEAAAWAEGRDDPVAELMEVAADPEAGPLREVATTTVDALAPQAS